MKSKLYDSPWGKGMPIAPDFIIKDKCNFQEEKQELIAMIDKLYAVDQDKVGNHPHLFFGSFTKPQWRQSMYKHSDHHLRQFSAYYFIHACIIPAHVYGIISLWYGYA
jgi:hypothetical protein